MTSLDEEKLWSRGTAKWVYAGRECGGDSRGDSIKGVFGWQEITWTLPSCIVKKLGFPIISFPYQSQPSKQTKNHRLDTATNQERGQCVQL